MTKELGHEEAFNGPGASAFSPVVIAPTYNNAGTVLAVLAGVESLGLAVIVVDDGCTDGTARLLTQWRSDRHKATVVRHPRNKGKGAALLSGFTAAAAAGYSHAVTIDTDGQLDPASIPSLLAVAQQAPTALVLGTRSQAIEGCPGRCLLGRRLSNLALRCECGVRVADSQCGLRVYPLDLVAGPGSPRWRSGWFAFETEVIARAAWQGRPVEEVAVECRYLPRETRVSHFKPWRDSLHSVALHAVLLATALLPWTGRRMSWGGGDATSRMRSWLSPARLWKEIVEGRAGHAEVAAGVSAGVLIANLPIYGAQSLLSLYVARRLHLHPLAVLMGSQVSTPPLGVGLIAAAIAVGHLVLRGRWAWSGLDAPSGRWSLLSGMLADWAVGSVVVGLASAMAAFVVAWVLLALLSRRRRRGRAGVAA